MLNLEQELQLRKVNENLDLLNGKMSAMLTKLDAISSILMENRLEKFSSERKLNEKVYPITEVNNAQDAIARYLEEERGKKNEQSN